MTGVLNVLFNGERINASIWFLKGGFFDSFVYGVPSVCHDFIFGLDYYR